MMRMSEAQRHECQVNIIKTILYINFSAFRKIATYKLHLVAFYTVNEFILVDLSECVHGVKI